MQPPSWVIIVSDISLVVYHTERILEEVSLNTIVSGCCEWRDHHSNKNKVKKNRVIVPAWDDATGRTLSSQTSTSCWTSHRLLLLEITLSLLVFRLHSSNQKILHIKQIQSSLSLWGNGTRTPVDTKIHRCSNHLYKWHSICIWPMLILLYSLSHLWLNTI